ncbi:MAG TPA: M14 family metallopeptidase [Candidatus Paceibacterota bacterium]|nr:M14 family metallopeptidase [Candidatus Paceibacterota bacterium]
MRSSRAVLLAGVVLFLCAAGSVAFLTLHKQSPAPASVEPQPYVPTEQTIGTSVQGRAITAYTYGSGPTDLLFVGGMHGGYEWNSVLLAYQFMDYVAQNPSVIPANVRVTVIPSLNPDGVYKVVGKEGRFAASDASTSTAVLASGRFNAHGVDLNRNFDCKWKSESTWQGRIVSAGTAAFSEPEAAALRSFVVQEKPVAAVFWHSKANAVYASECKEGILPGTRVIMNAYAHAAAYPTVDVFDAYPITGDAEGWLASIHIPAITVELQTHETVEWDRNWAGITAVLAYYAGLGR